VSTKAHAIKSWSTLNAYATADDPATRYAILHDQLTRI
jgi:hypothetical protein